MAYHLHHFHLGLNPQMVEERLEICDHLHTVVFQLCMTAASRSQGEQIPQRIFDQKQDCFEFLPKLDGYKFF